MPAIVISDAELTVTADEIGNVVHHRLGDGDAAEAAIPDVVKRGMVTRASNGRGYVLTPAGRWVLGEVAS